MSAPIQHVLLVSSSDDLIDQMFAVYELCKKPYLRMTILRDSVDLDEHLDQHRFSIALLDCHTLGTEHLAKVSKSLNPKPVMALSYEESAQHILELLRSGADDVFLVSELSNNPEAFLHSMRRQLGRAKYIEDAQRLQNSLERSLNELRNDHRAAQLVQKNLLPPARQVLCNFLFEYTLTPSLLLSGDFVEAIEINHNQVMFFLADVSGHGASSALVTVLLKNLSGRLLRRYLRYSNYDILSPSASLMRFNQEILATGLDKHLTMFVGVIDSESSQLVYAVGGHHPMPILTTDEGSVFLEGRGMPLGLFERPTFDERVINLPPNFNLTLFSDGILEIIEGDTLEAKEAWLINKLNNGYVSSADLTAMLEFGEETHPDDIAIMTVSRARK